MGQPWITHPTTSMSHFASVLLEMMLCCVKEQTNFTGRTFSYCSGFIFFNEDYPSHRIVFSIAAVFSLAFGMLHADPT